MHIFTDGITKVSLSNNNLRVTLIQNGPDNTQVEAGTLIIPGNRAGQIIKAMADGVKQLDEQMKSQGNPEQ